MESKNLYLNRVVIAHLHHLRSPEVLGLEKFPSDGNHRWVKVIEQFNPDALHIYANVLFSQAAEKIYVVSSDKKRFVEDATNISPIAKSRIQLTDQKGKLYQDVKSFFKPIFIDAISVGAYNPSLERHGPFNRASHSNLRQSGHVLPRLAKETHLLCVATKLKAQVDLNLNEYRNLIKASKELQLSQESISRLSILEGIFAPYKRTTVDSFYVSQDYSGKTVSERLFDLLEDAKIQDMSHERYLLGVPAKLKLAQRRIGLLVREILSRRKYQAVLSASKDVISAATQASIPSPNLTDIVLGEPYSPPLVSLNKFKPKPKSYVENDREMVMEILSDERDIKLAQSGKYALKVRYKEYLDELLPDFTFSELVERED